MAGFVVSINGKEFVSVSTEGLNILTVQVHGDMIGQEIAVVDVFGGLYGEGERDKHLIWLSEREIESGDEVQISFLETAATTHRGKTIAELNPGNDVRSLPEQSMEEMFQYIADQTRVREAYEFELTEPEGQVIRTRTGTEDYSFHLTAMWQWSKPEQASVWLSSNSIDGIRNGREGAKHARLSLRFGESLKFRVKT